MPSIHSVAQIQHRKQEKIEIIERKFKEILEKDYGNQSSYKNTHHYSAPEQFFSY